MKALAILFILLPIFSMAQLNQMDANGLRQGKWKKFHENGKVRYEGSFKDNEPTGEWKRFHDNGKLQANLRYSETSDSTFSELFNRQGKRIAKGNFISEKKEGIWEFYKGLKLVSEANFSEGIKNGLEKMFYESGELLEETDWVNAQKHGKYQAYFENGNPYMQCKFKENKRDGLCLIYFENGVMELDAFYVNDLRDGEWKYFNNNGDLHYTLIYNRGNLQNPQVLDSIKALQFEDMLQNQPNIVDPEKFMQNPQEFMMKMKNQK